MAVPELRAQAWGHLELDDGDSDSRLLRAVRRSGQRGESMSNRVVGVVTTETARFVCRRCRAEVLMTAIIDARSVRSKIWRETPEHVCRPSSVVDREGSSREAN